MMTTLGVIAGYALPYGTGFLNIFLVAICAPITGPCCNMVWILAGSKLQGVFQRHRKPINILMAVSLFYCAVMMVVS